MNPFERTLTLIGNEEGVLEIRLIMWYKSKWLGSHSNSIFEHYSTAKTQSRYQSRTNSLLLKSTETISQMSTSKHYALAIQ